MDMLDRLDVDNNILNDEFLKNIYGGISISGTLINSITSALKTLLEAGRSLGTALRRLKSKKICKSY